MHMLFLFEVTFPHPDFPTVEVRLETSIMLFNVDLVDIDEEKVDVKIEYARGLARDKIERLQKVATSLRNVKSIGVPTFLP